MSQSKLRCLTALYCIVISVPSVRNVKGIPTIYRFQPESQIYTVNVLYAFGLTHRDSKIVHTVLSLTYPVNFYHTKLFYHWAWCYYFQGCFYESIHLYRFDEEDGDYSMNSLRINFDNDLMCDLYRHWNLYDSLCQSIYSASTFRIWSLKGKSRFHEFLAVMGYVTLAIHASKEPLCITQALVS